MSFLAIQFTNAFYNSSAIGEACHQASRGVATIFFSVSNFLLLQSSRAVLTSKIFCQVLLSLRKFEKPSVLKSIKILQTINLYFLSFPYQILISKNSNFSPSRSIVGIRTEKIF